MKSKFLLHNAACLLTVTLVMANSILTYAGNKLDNERPITGNVISSTVATKWGEMTVRTMKNTPGNTPTYGSRAVGYMGITMYESIVWGSSKNKSMAGQLVGLVALPKPNGSQKYNWVLALNAGQAYMLKQLYEQTADVNKESIDSLENIIYQSEKTLTSQDVADRSVQFGQEIAKAVFEWSKTDGGFQGYKRNFDSTYQLPVGNGLWKAPIHGQSPIALPLHPYWGNNRTFSPNNQKLAVPKIIEFDFHEGSDYYKEMFAVYEKRKKLSQTEKEIANWWGDDPSQTFSPPGHSYNLATITINKVKPDLFKAAETYARVGMAVADAFINCWKCKYAHHAQRPWSFIYYSIDTLWDLYWPEPPFPAFYSGHAGQAAAAAVVLTDLYGENFEFIDNSHVGRPRDEQRLVEYKARRFNSFWEAAEESANSRFYGGIHTCQDNQVGLVEGGKVGRNINVLVWKKIK